MKHHADRTRLSTTTEEKATVIRHHRPRRGLARLTAFAFVCVLLALPATSVAAPVLDLKLESDPLADEVQFVTVRATAGTYRLNFGSGGPGVSETADIAPTASAGEVEAALNALANISAGGGSVTVLGGPGDALGTDPYRVFFNGGPLRMRDVQQMTISPGSAPLSGGSKLALVRTRTDGGVARGDLRLDYTLAVSNSAAVLKPSVGSTLNCSTGGWNNAPTSFSYQWTRNGEPLVSPEDIANGSQTNAYELQPEDAGEAIQCRVTGVNATAEAVAVTLPPTVVNPQPSAEPPMNVGTGNPRPTMVPGTSIRYNETTEEFEAFIESQFRPNKYITCNAPTNWEGSGISWSFRWLQNGVALGSENVVETTATSSKYELQPDDRFHTLQCEATAEDSNGKKSFAIAQRTAFEEMKDAPVPTAIPATSFAGQEDNTTSGTVTAEFELAPGHETFVFKTEGTGWSCSSQSPIATEPAKATCTRADALAPQASYPPLTISMGIGSDAPDPSGVRATVSGGGSASAEASDQFPIGPARPFEITSLETQVPDHAGNEETQAGAHPIAAHASFAFSRNRNFQDRTAEANESGFIAHQSPVETVRHINIHTPRGFVGNALAVPELCPSVEATLAEPTECPRESVVGGIDLVLSGVGVVDAPIYSMKPEYGTPAQFAFPVRSVNGVYTFYPELRADDGYAISLLSAPVPGGPQLLEVRATLCAYGAKTNPTGQTRFEGCKQPGEPDPDGPGPLTGGNPTPLVTLPTRCAGGAPVTNLEIDSWQRPGEFKSRSFEAPRLTGCEKVEFEPEAEIRPISNRADSPTGLDVELTLPTNGLEGRDDEGNLDAEALAQANMKTARVTFPEGMAINPSAGHGLSSCSEAQARMRTNQPHACPDASKIGTLEIDTPIIQETLTGAIYVGKQSEAPRGSLIGLFLIFESKKDGIIIKIPGEVTPDPQTGQLVTTFDDIVEAPFSRAKFSFNQGPRASLLTPPRCGHYEVKAEFVPWTVANLDNPDPSEIVTETTGFDVTEGPDGGPCPDGQLRAGFSAGTVDPTAGGTSPFVMQLRRDDGTQRFDGLELSPPAGLTAYLRGVPYCPDAVIDSISSEIETGQAEIDNPSCPAASQIGTAVAGAGSGPHPYYVQGQAYLAGPYKGAPLSIAVVTPAVAGPFDLGSVVIRNALYVDPSTARITAKSDPIPTILHGVLLNVRDIIVRIDRPGFALNPTSCLEKQVDAKVSGQDGGQLDLNQRFQVDGCRALGFKPRMSLRLKGGTRRGAHPALRAVVRPRAGDANIGRTQVKLPRSAFLDQAHIGTVCTRVQWAQDACPKGSIYGRAIAHTPLLDYPLRGRVYLRSSNNLLPDLVADLRGPAHQPIRIELAGRTDSVKGALRNTFDVVPDAPVSHFRLELFGGKRGLIVNSQNLCRRKAHRAAVNMRAQNGRRHFARPVVRNDCAKKAKRKRKRAKRSSHRRGR